MRFSTISDEDKNILKLDNCNGLRRIHIHVCIFSQKNVKLKLFPLSQLFISNYFIVKVISDIRDIFETLSYYYHFHYLFR